ncbi:hypothetical protein Nepgr_003928 [Nepenthes gracilis]|uniref:Uncharacterized protein n=1 Tax=Nepenthes gracilis TaxID=150966 RepID=A0AAD3S0I9_NEPGR|nr:hypothetical protein Nepgr_003928 [Nepenthes gracilis]
MEAVKGIETTVLVVYCYWCNAVGVFSYLVFQLLVVLLAVGGVVVPIILLAVAGAFTMLLTLAECVDYVKLCIRFCAAGSLISPSAVVAENKAGLCFRLVICRVADATVSLVDSLGVGLLTVALEVASGGSGMLQLLSLQGAADAKASVFSGVAWSCVLRLASAFVPTGSAISSEVIPPPVKVAVGFGCHNQFRMVQARCFEGLEHIWYGQITLTGAAFHAKAAY